MTIDSTVELSRDLSHHTDWPLFSNAGVAGREVALAACTLTWRKPGARPSDVIGPASAGLERLLTQLRASLGYGMHMLVVHATLQPKSAVLMHRGLWRMDVLKSMPAAIARGAEGQDRMRQQGAIRGTGESATGRDRLDGRKAQCIRGHHPALPEKRCTDGRDSREPISQRSIPTGRMRGSIRSGLGELRSPHRFNRRDMRPLVERSVRSRSRTRSVPCRCRGSKGESHP